MQPFVLSNIGQRTMPNCIVRSSESVSHAWRFCSKPRNARYRLGPAHAKLPDSAPADALTDVLGGVSSNEGRTARTNNLVLGGDNSLEKWKELDAKLDFVVFSSGNEKEMQVNEYPAERSFKAIGTGGQDFVASMARAVEQAVGQVLPSSVQQRPSAKGNYVSVTIGPVTVTDPEQLAAKMVSGLKLL